MQRRRQLAFPEAHEAVLVRSDPDQNQVIEPLLGNGGSRRGAGVDPDRRQSLRSRPRGESSAWQPRSFPGSADRPCTSTPPRRGTVLLAPQIVSEAVHVAARSFSRVRSDLLGMM